jgi:RNA polymerase sigma-70 factor (sigma-E family)
VSTVGFDDLVNEHGAALLRVAYLLCRDSQQAEDLVQDALLKGLAQWRRAGRPEQPGPYLRKIVLNEYLGWRRRRASTELVGLPADEQGEPDVTEAHADRDLMWQLLGTLSPRARAVLVLRYYEALPDNEIAAHLGCAEATVRSIAARAFATLRLDPGLADLASGRPLEKEA